MKILNTQFKKNGLLYILIERNESKALYQLTTYEGTIIGYEVCRIHIKEMYPYRGGLMLGEEYITRNRDYAREQCKTFFPLELEKAKEYYTNFI
jgi:hypothetical protein